MDFITTVAVAYVSKDGIEKLLGPTFEYFGIGLRNTVEKLNNSAQKNIGKIFQKTINKTGQKIEEKGLINPRILKEVVLDGSFCDTNVVQEYYSGILASARTEDGTDDGIYYINIMKGLSARQLKLHYAIYSRFMTENKNKNYNLHTSEDISKIKVNFSLRELVDILDLKKYSEIDKFTSDDIPALYNSGLIGIYNFNTKKEEKKQFEFSVQLLGISLFLQALGYAEIFSPKCLNDPKIDEVIDSMVSLEEL